MGQHHQPAQSILSSGPGTVRRPPTPAGERWPSDAVFTSIYLLGEMVRLVRGGQVQLEAGLGQAGEVNDKTLTGDEWVERDEWWFAVSGRKWDKGGEGGGWRVTSDKRRWTPWLWLYYRTGNIRIIPFTLQPQRENIPRLQSTQTTILHTPHLTVLTSLPQMFGDNRGRDQSVIWRLF